MLTDWSSSWVERERCRVILRSLDSIWATVGASFGLLARPNVWVAMLCMSMLRMTSMILMMLLSLLRRKYGLWRYQFWASLVIAGMIWIMRLWFSNSVAWTHCIRLCGIAFKSLRRCRCDCLTSLGRRLSIWAILSRVRRWATLCGGCIASSKRLNTFVSCLSNDTFKRLVQCLRISICVRRSRVVALIDWGRLRS